MAAQNQGDLFDAYFRRADLDRDGRISGAEAVAFFQGSNLPKQVLAQIWTYADQNRIGYLGREEFYNYLKLVTVAQSKRELTPEIVRAALYTPASSKIPPPQINFTGTPASQPSAAGANRPSSQMGTLQNPGFRPPLSQPNANVNQQYSQAQLSGLVRPPNTVSGAATPLAQGVGFQGIVGDSGKTAVGGPSGVASQVSDRTVGPLPKQVGFGPGTSVPMPTLPPRPPAASGMTPSTAPTVPSKPPVPQNGFASGSVFGGDAFSMTSSQSKTGDAGVTVSPGSVPVSSAIGPVSVGTQPPPKQGSFDSLQNSFTVQPVGGQTQGMQSFPKQNLQTLARNAPVVPPNNSAATQSQMQWPRLSQTDVQKYAKVFVEVDTDKDGKITGEQARHLFLSWRLPREVLKQVWDLSDQDNDSMLSLREFCIALYLMERYREGRPLPAVLPNSIMLDLPAIVQPAGGYGNAAWGHAPGMQHQQGVPGSGHANARPPARASGKPPLPVPALPADDRMQPKPQKAKVPVLEKHLVDQLSEEEQKTLNAKFQEASEATKKVEELEKDIKESREKIEFYRVKMQELVLYKSRCDSRFNEITERAASDQREVELLAKKYEEKYRQTGDVASKLTLEEATFRDIQGRKMELYQAVVKMEQDGNADDSLQVRADRIQSNLEELVQSMSERCKKYGLRAKPTTLLELPFGWQPGIQEGAADWDEDWDKFEDEGYTFVKELTLDVQNVIAPPKTKTKPVKKEKKSVYESEATAPADAETKSEKPADEQVSENGSVHNQSEVDQVRSPSSPAAKSMRGSPYGKSLDSHFGETVGSDASSQAKETHAQSDHEGAGSTFSVDRRSDEPAWGAFDSHDDADSVWGFGSSKELDAERRRDDLFGHGEWSLPPIKTSPLDGGIFKKKETSIFADSVPGTPFSSTFSPQKYGEGPDRPLNFSRFDSFGSTDSSFQTRETLTRFDSIRSTKDSDYGLGFPSFDDSDPFGSGPFKSSLGSETPRRDLDPFGSVGPSRSSLGAETPRAYPDPFAPLVETPRRDSDHHFAYSGSFKSTIGSETPRTESDPFGFGGPFRSSFGGETPRRDSDFGGPFQSSFASDTPRSDFGGPFQSSFASDTPRSDFGGPFHSTFGTETPRSDFGGPFRSSFGAETPRSDFGGPFRSSSFGNETPRHELDPFGSTGPFKSSFSETPRSTNNWSAF